MTFAGLNRQTGTVAKYAVDHDRHEVVIRCDQLETTSLIEFAKSLPDSDVITRVRDGVASAPPYQLLTQLCGRLYRVRVSESGGSHSLWIGESAELREERARVSALLALSKLSELGMRGIAQLEVEGSLDIHVDASGHDIPKHIAAAVESAVLFDEAVYTLALCEIQRTRHQWPGMFYMADGVLREFCGEDEWLRWLSLANS